MKKKVKAICEICGNSRFTEKCHIIPRFIDPWTKNRTYKGKTLQEINILHLCPNHHKYLDRGTLTQDEWSAIREKFINVFELIFSIYIDESIEIEDKIGSVIPKEFIHEMMELTFKRVRNVETERIKT